MRAGDPSEDQATAISGQGFKSGGDDHHAADERAAKGVVEFLGAGGGLWVLVRHGFLGVWGEQRRDRLRSGRWRSEKARGRVSRARHFAANWSRLVVDRRRAGQRSLGGLTTAGERSAKPRPTYSASEYHIQVQNHHGFGRRLARLQPATPISFEVAVGLPRQQSADPSHAIAVVAGIPKGDLWDTRLIGRRQIPIAIAERRSRLAPLARSTSLPGIGIVRSAACPKGRPLEYPRRPRWCGLGHLFLSAGASARTARRTRVDGRAECVGLRSIAEREGCAQDQPFRK
jgi:hypothetical protein